MAHHASVFQHNDAGSTQLTVRRRHILEDTFHKLRNNLDVTKPIRVKFIGEPAIDTGKIVHLLLRKCHT